MSGEESLPQQSMNDEQFARCRQMEENSRVQPYGHQYPASNRTPLSFSMSSYSAIASAPAVSISHPTRSPSLPYPLISPQPPLHQQSSQVVPPTRFEPYAMTTPPSASPNASAFIPAHQNRNDFHSPVSAVPVAHPFHVSHRAAPTVPVLDHEVTNRRPA
jgi:hypothetical protein